MKRRTLKIIGLSLLAGVIVGMGLLARPLVGSWKVWQRSGALAIRFGHEEAT
jgi:hypothetical protein